MFRLGKVGAVRQKLDLTLDPAGLLAISTTAEDVTLQKRHYGTFGSLLARKVLARHFPEGTAKPDIESWTARIEETGGRHGSGRRDVLGKRVEELISAAYPLKNRD